MLALALEREGVVLSDFELSCIRASAVSKACSTDEGPLAVVVRDLAELLSTHD